MHHSVSIAYVNENTEIITHRVVCVCVAETVSVSIGPILVGLQQKTRSTRNCNRTTEIKI